MLQDVLSDLLYIAVVMHMEDVRVCMLLSQH